MIASLRWQVRYIAYPLGIAAMILLYCAATPTISSAQTARDSVISGGKLTLDQGPEPITPLRPIVERAAKRYGKSEGVVEAQLLIGIYGAIKDVKIRPSEDTVFDAVVKDALMAAQFIPARGDSGPVNWWVPERIEYRSMESSIRDSSVGWTTFQGTRGKKDSTQIVVVVQEAKPMSSLLSAVEDVARKRGKRDGEVKARLLVSTQGFVTKVSLPRSEDTLFDNDVKDALMRVRFIPAMTDSGPVTMWVEQAVAYGSKKK